jgi:hypothetical protein
MPPVKRVGYAVVGLGSISQVAVLPAFAHSEGAELIALVSGDSAVKLVDDLAGESPVSADYPVGAVVISGDGTGDQTVGSLDVNALEGWT